MAQRKRGHIDITFDEDAPKKDATPSTASSPTPITFREVALLPTTTDNCAIVTRRVEKGQVILDSDRQITLASTLLEGHRFCYNFIRKGDPLLSWGLPFGFALRDIEPGEYVVNQGVLESLSLRGLDFELPSEPNFEYTIQPASLKDFPGPGKPIEKYAQGGTFMGYERPAPRRVGTRNHILVLGVTSSVGPFARSLESTLKASKAVDFSAYKNVDGVVSVAHTEGGTGRAMNNIELSLRTLAGFIVHGNIGAVLIIDSPLSEELSASNETLSHTSLMRYMKQNDYPIDKVLYDVFVTTGDTASDLKQCAGIIKSWVPGVNSCERKPVRLASLSIALQCGGSDAFSGISGNPLAALGARELIKHGGSAVLAETDELIGAEKYILKMARSEQVAKDFLATIARFTDWTEWHGHNPEGNPSGGNKYRGLYNIALKSLGAATKKHPEITLDGVLKYGERLTEGGFYFMDSPGNDLESIAGQVATGCQLIYFITGNGSITNFPFVPTVKIVTTTNRFNLLQKDMDINAGAYQDGMPLSVLGEKLFDYTVKIGEGMRSIGEKAGHAQVSLWRDWPMAVRNDALLADLNKLPMLHSGAPLTLGKKAASGSGSPTFMGLPSKGTYSTDYVGLLLPTSLCSSEVARSIAEHLNALAASPTSPFSLTRFVTLPHTEGCGMSAGSCEDIYRRTMLTHSLNALVKYCVFLEHGCERTHNDYMGHHLESEHGQSRASYGWVSIQLDGGIDAAKDKIVQLFAEACPANATATPRQEVPMSHLRVALVTPPRPAVSAASARALAQVARPLVDCGALVVLPQFSSLCSSNVFLGAVLDDPRSTLMPTLAYSQRPTSHGLHIMETLSDNWTEMMTGLGGCGVEIVLALVEGSNIGHPLPGHPMLRLLRVANPHSLAVSVSPSALADYDLVLSENEDEWEHQLFDLVLNVASGKYEPKFTAQADFQISRGPTGISV